MANKERRMAYRRLKKIKPTLKWQVGDYSRTIELIEHLPYTILLLCKILNTTPRQIILDFLDNLSCGSWKREGRDKAKGKLVDYVIEMGYGNEYFTEEEIRILFKDFDALGMVWPNNSGDMKLVDKYATWRNRHYKFLFKKWFKKIRRKV
jgi:hypothetical protein